MKQFLIKYLIGLGLIIGLIITMSPASSEAPASCHVESQGCNKVECINKDCGNSCKAHCKHN
mgnify:CR=1 FL=1